jgi:CheY-like chemotaxis protein
MKPVQISEVIQGALTIVGAQVRKTVSRIELAIEDNLPLIQGHFQKIEQVITNLLINAHQAILPGRKGIVRITARHVKSLSAVAVEIEDNGQGMEQGVLSHLFDPFFTTRRDRGGTGLGLSISYGLIREHNGLIGVLSQPGLGSRFLLLLPANGQKKIELRPVMLCMDHDTRFLNQLKTNFVDAVEYPLTSDGCPGDIILYLLEHPEIDLILAEIDLPGEDGWTLLDKIKGRFPLLPVILYSRHGAARERAPHDGQRAEYILKKPFRIDQLQKIIHEVGRQRL